MKSRERQKEHSDEITAKFIDNDMPAVFIFQEYLSTMRRDDTDRDEKEHSDDMDGDRGLYEDEKDTCKGSPECTGGKRDISYESEGSNIFEKSHVSYGSLIPGVFYKKSVFLQSLQVWPLQSNIYLLRARLTFSQRLQMYSFLLQQIPDLSR